MGVVGCEGVFNRMTSKNKTKGNTKKNHDKVVEVGEVWGDDGGDDDEEEGGCGDGSGDGVRLAGWQTSRRRKQPGANHEPTRNQSETNQRKPTRNQPNAYPESK